MKFGISQKILIYFSIISLIIFLVFSFFVISLIQNNIIPYTKNLVNEMTVRTSHQLGNLIEGYINELKVLSNDKAFKSGNWDLVIEQIDYLADKINADFEMIFFADTNGKAYTSTKANANVKDRAYFIDIFEKNKPYSISDPIISRTTGAQIFVIAVPVYNSNKEKAGIIASTITLHKLSEIASTVSFGKSGYSFIFDSNKVIIAHPNKELIMKKNIFQLEEDGYSGFKEAEEKINSNDNGIFLVSNPQKIKENIIFADIPYSNNWKIALSIEERELNSSISAVIRLIIIITISSILVIVIFSIILGRLIVRPVKNVSKFFAQMSEGEGDLTQKITHKSKDEVGELSNNFNN
ncbi:MAG: cache domain-containing protein, partial [Exilispira sp.]